VRASLRRVGAVEVAAGREDGREPGRRASVAGRVRESVGALGAGQVPALLQQRAQVEGAVLIAALVRALVTGLRRSHISTRLGEHPEVQRGARVAKCVGLAVRELGAGWIIPLL
jgi:hypothetical protein